MLIVATKDGVESVTSAKSGSIQVDGNGRSIVLTQGQRNEQNAQNGQKTLSRFESYRADVGDKVLSETRGLPPKARPTIELLQEPTAPNQGELAWRVGLVLAAFNMLLLGIGMSAANPRHASNWNLLFALLGFFAYYNVINLSQSWVSSGRVDIGAALMLAHGSTLVLALSVLWWRDKGTSRVAVAARRRRARRARALARA